MKFLFIGNSITNGNIGVSFVNLIKADYPDWQLINAGINGDTLKNIGKRLITELDKTKDYDFIVIEAGYNDIILPLFAKKNIAFRLILYYVIRKGRFPIENVQSFENEYINIINTIKTMTRATIILTTLGCINENLSSVSNLNKNLYNEKIRNISALTNSKLADVGKEVAIVLRNTNQTDFFLESFLQTVYLDRKLCNTEESANKLSRKRKLLLTTDGIHLNTNGADIFRRMIERQIVT